MNAPVRIPTPFATIGKEVAGNGYRPLPIFPGKKVPGEFSRGKWYAMRDWPRFRDEAPGRYGIIMYGLWDDAGIGIVLGNEAAPGWEVAAIDHDTDDPFVQEMIDGALRRSTVEKRGRRGFTGFYLVPTGTKGMRFARGKETILEILTGTATRQTVIPPSIHPDSGEPYVWLTRKTLANTPAADLPRLDQDDLERLIDTVRSLEGVDEARTLRAAPGQGPRGEVDNVFQAVNAAALRRLDDWVPGLDLYGCRRTSLGYEAVPTWRAGGTGRPLSERKRSLKMHPSGIRDFGSGDGHSPIDVVMRALDMLFGDAFQWLEAQLGLTPDGWDLLPLGMSFSPEVDTAPEPEAEIQRVDVEEARRIMIYGVRSHIEEGTGDRAIRVSTGVGKTTIAVEAIADEIHRWRAAGFKGRVLFAVPTHRLGDQVVAKFGALGVVAKAFRGREALDPDNGETMCMDLEAVKNAVALRENVSRSCCEGRNPKTGTVIKCKFFDQCGYQRQKALRPDVWVASHQILFIPQSGLGKVEAVFVDEAFWQSGLWASRGGLTLDAIGAAPPTPSFRTDWRDDLANDVSVFRAKLERGLRRQNALGGVARINLAAEGLTTEECVAAQAAEWLLAEGMPLYPNMPAAERKKAAELARGMQFIHDRTAVWKAAQALLADADEAAVSGGLAIEEERTKHGVVRIARTRGIKPIAPDWEVTTLVMDATVPPMGVINRYFPKMVLAADIEARTPHATIRHVMGAPVSANKLMKSEAARNLHSIRRAILHRFFAYGRKPTLVIAQKAVAEWLIEEGLPHAISIEHYNAVAGLDHHRDVRLLIAIGRTLPPPEAVEALSSAMTGKESVKTPEPTGKGRGRWYPKATKGNRLRDGRFYSVNVEQHPDETTEALRWQVCEAQLLQSIGRGRAVNRTEETPLALEIWTDTILPVEVDEVVNWADVDQGGDAEMMLAGVILESPSDMAKIWPEVWRTATAARHWQSRATSAQNPIKGTLYREVDACGFRYRAPGERQKWRRGSYDPAVVIDPKAWLEERLGITLAAFELLSAPAKIVKTAPVQYVLQEAPAPFPARTMGIGWRALVDLSKPSPRFLDPKVFEPSRQAVHLMQ